MNEDEKEHIKALAKIASQVSEDHRREWWERLPVVDKALVEASIAEAVNQITEALTVMAKVLAEQLPYLAEQFQAVVIAFDKSNIRLCKDCKGLGSVYGVIGVDYVTHDMALDGCDPSLEGMPREQTGWFECPECKGMGAVLIDGGENGSAA